MEEDFVYIEGKMDERDRARLIRLLRRVEDVGGFDVDVWDDIISPWLVVVGWGEGDDSPVSVSRLMSGLVFTGYDVEAVIHKIKQWLAE